MKPWEERWTFEPTRERIVFGPTEESDSLYWRTTPSEMNRAQPDPTKEVSEARARLAACAPEMARMLLRTEWIWDNHANAPLCPWCLNDKTRDHAVDCAWLVLMKKAGIR